MENQNDEQAALNRRNASEAQELFQVVATLGLKPFMDGDKWCFLYGVNLQDGVCGFGETVAQAAGNFNNNIGL